MRLIQIRIQFDLANRKLLGLIRARRTGSNLKSEFDSPNVAIVSE